MRVFPLMKGEGCRLRAKTAQHKCDIDDGMLGFLDYSTQTGQMVPIYSEAGARSQLKFN